MLIEFTVQNFKSIKDEAQLSFVADAGKEHRDTHVFESDLAHRKTSTTLVRSAAIYGANASGKTNLLSALQAMKTMVHRSAQGLNKLPMVPFKFDPVSRDEPTTLETMFVANGVAYRYGFAATASTVIQEWLYAWPRGRVQLWYEREAGDYRFGNKLGGDKKVWQRATRPDALFLSTAVGLNSEQLLPVFNWFTRHLRIAGIGGWTPTFSYECCEDERKQGIIRFLRSADFGISDLSLTREDFDPNSLPKDMSPALEAILKARLEGRQVPTLRLTHETPGGIKEALDLEDESDGTQKIFALAGPWLDALKHGYVVAIDELHDNLHPALVGFLINCFHDPRLNPRCAQLLFSTHETSVLNQHVFRRDQIWFCERDGSQATTLFPLNDFRLRKGVTNLERAYLSGRFGALPFVSSDQLEVEEL